MEARKLKTVDDLLQSDEERAELIGGEIGRRVAGFRQAGAGVIQQTGNVHFLKQGWLELSRGGG